MVAFTYRGRGYIQLTGRSNYTRWVFSLVFVSRTFACLPDVREFALPLLAIATLAVSASFVPDFWALRSAPRAAP